MIKTVKYRNKVYPFFQTEGNASRFAIPFAQTCCSGKGVDIGCMKKEWAFPGSIPIDINFDDEWNALHLPFNNLDYIFSSHCLEHIPDWVDVMKYWYSQLRKGGILFLYLPHFEQEYWRPWNNRKHIHSFNGNEIEAYMQDKKYKNIFKSGVDLNSSFIIYGEK
jgi:SAM-dependent methyltransferase